MSAADLETAMLQRPGERCKTLPWRPANRCHPNKKAQYLLADAFCRGKFRSQRSSCLFEGYCAYHEPLSLQRQSDRFSARLLLLGRLSRVVFLLQDATGAELFAQLEGVVVILTRSLGICSQHSVACRGFEGGVCSRASEQPYPRSQPLSPWNEQLVSAVVPSFTTGAGILHVQINEPLTVQYPRCLSQPQPVFFYWGSRPRQNVQS